MECVIDVHKYLLDLWLSNPLIPKPLQYTHHVRGTAEMYNWQFFLPTLFASQCTIHIDITGHTQTVCTEHCSLFSIQD